VKIGPRRFPNWIAWTLVLAGVATIGIVLAPGLVSFERSKEGLPTLAGEGQPADAQPSQSDAKRLEYAALQADEGRFAESEKSWRDSEEAGEYGELDSNLACIIEPNRIVEIGSPVRGLIHEIPVERADLIEKGQILVVLESQVEQAAVELARKRASMNENVLVSKERFELGKRRKHRVNELFENDALSLDLRDEAVTEAELARLELARAQAERKLAALELKQAQAVLERRSIPSPFDGVVMERSMSAGERVDHETILKVAQIDPLRVEVILPSAMFGQVMMGANATVVPEVPGDTVHVAKVSIVDRVVDSASGTFGVRLELPNPDHSIPGGVHCQIQFLDE
jgi:RND family efflux transporter MFP subunit